jgi:hypothetical protein
MKLFYCNLHFGVPSIKEFKVVTCGFSALGDGSTVSDRTHTSSLKG